MAFSNPFITDRPLTDRDVFVGREAEFAQLTRSLDEGARIVLLYAHSRLGKTSFVNQLGLWLHPRWHVLRIDLHKAHDISEVGLCHSIAQAVRARDDGAIAHDATCKSWEQLAHEVRGERPYLVCLDQITAADLAARKGQWQTILNSASKAIAGSAKLAVLICVEGYPLDLADAALPKGIAELVLPPLDAQDSEELLGVPLRGTLALGYEIIRAAYRLTGGYPYLLQLFGSFCYERYGKMGWVPPNGISHLMQDVLTAVGDHLASRWERLGEPARLVLSLMSESTGQHGMATPDDVVRLLGAAVRISEHDVEQGLEQLCAYDMLEELGGPTYRVASDIMREWVRRHHPLQATIAASSAYRSRRIRVATPRRPRRIDWAGLALWGVVLLLLVAIVAVWRSREAVVVWTHRPTQDAEPTITPEDPSILPSPEAGVAPGYIVYQAKADPDAPWDIYIMRSDGSDPTRLTNSGANDTLPSLSPDGRKIAFVSDREGNREIYVMNRNGADQTNLTRNAADDWTPSWSPDGNEIAFASFRDDRWELYIMNANGTNQRRITTHQAADYGPAWSPNGDEIAFTSNRTGNLDIHVLSLVDRSVRRLTTDPATDQSPAWSPDGTQIAWESYRDGNMEIYVMDVDGSNIRNLSQDAYADDHGVAWSPWGDRIAFYSNRDGGWDIYTLDLASGRRSNVTLGDAIEQSPHWGR